MKAKQKKSVNIGVGTASIMTVFVVLCFTVFATLYFLQARTYAQRVERYNDNVEQYYEADTEASKKLIEIQNLVNTSQSIDDLEASLSNLGYVLEGSQLSYQITINENAHLLVECEIHQEEIMTIEIVTWRQVATPEENYGIQGFDF